MVGVWRKYRSEWLVLLFTIESIEVSFTLGEMEVEPDLQDRQTHRYVGLIYFVE